MKESPVVFEQYSATGVLHVHSTRSDGYGEPEDIIQFGIQAGLDYIAFNDHRNLKLMDEGWHGKITHGLMSIVGTELQHTDLKSHLLVYGVETIKPVGHILDQLDHILSMNGIAIIAHPVETRPYIPTYGEFPWGFGTTAPVSGIEVWNWMSSWKRRVNVINGLVRINFPDRLVKNPPKDAVDMWFETGGCLVGGADAHAHKIFGKEVFGYKMLFDRVRTHIVLSRPFKDPSQFTEALRTGNCFISNAIHGDASEYRSQIHQGSLYLKLPASGRVLLREKGKPFHRVVNLEKGIHNLGSMKCPVYIEIRKNGRTWIADGITHGSVE